MKRRLRDSAGKTAATRPNRRQFLSTLVVGATYTACSGPRGEGHPPERDGSAADAALGHADARTIDGPSNVASLDGASAYDARADAGTPPHPTPDVPATSVDGPAADGPPAHKSVSDRVVLGRTGIVVSRMAMGSGTHGTGGTSSQTMLGVPTFARLLVEGYHEQGITFWETADQYGSHPHLKEAIRQVGRQNVVILTKTLAETADQARGDLDRFRRELGVDTIDILLLHNRQSGTWTTECAGAMDVLAKAKQDGIIRAHGVSCHTLEALRLAARTPWVDVDLARINPAGIEMDADPNTVKGVLREMKTAGKGVIGMKILGVGQLANRLDTAVSHAVQLDAIDAFTIGFTNRKQLDEIAAKVAQAPV